MSDTWLAHEAATGLTCNTDRQRGERMILTTTEGQSDLPRYFAQVFAMAQKLGRGRIDFVLDDGRRFRADGAAPGPVAELHIHNGDVFTRLIREGDLGFSDAYLEGWWSTPDLQAFMDLIHRGNDHVYDGFPGMGLIRAYEKLRFWLQRNHKAQARKNIAHHYDLGNDFYKLWLDESMTYSSALFETGQESLERAQEAKYAQLIDQIGAQPGDHILEISCGWGGFGASYDLTLRRWHQTFNDRWDEVAALGFGERFRRMWNYYLTSCASAFEAENCDVTQITVSRPA